MDSKDGGVSHTRAESIVLATSGDRDIEVSGIGVSRYRDTGYRISGYQGIGISGYRGFGVSGYRNIGLAGYRVIGDGKAGGVGRAGRAERAGRLVGHAEPCQADWRSGGRGVSIGKDDGVAMVISLFHPGRVRGLGHGISMDAGHRR